VLVVFARYEAVTAATVKTALFWILKTCISETSQIFRGTYRLHIQGGRLSGAKKTTQAGGNFISRNVGLSGKYMDLLPRGP
jgi:hypothetical protein